VREKRRVIEKEDRLPTRPPRSEVLDFEGVCDMWVLAPFYSVVFVRARQKEVFVERFRNRRRLKWGDGVR
jgi:hypothetical protein